MKRKIIFGLFLFACCFTVGRNIEISLNKNGLDNLLLKNIEALAAGDADGSVLISCYDTISADGPLALTERPYCITCSSLPGRSFTNESSCRKKY